MGFRFLTSLTSNKRKEQLLSYLTNPFGTSTACEVANLDSTISCNETLFPNLLYSASSEVNPWGHDGRGVVFTDNNNLIDGNPQLATAERGETLSFSTELISERYYDDEETTPISSYMIYGLLSEGLSADQSSVVVKVDGESLSSGAYELAYEELTPDQAASYGYDFLAALVVTIPWSENGVFTYNDGAKIELTYQVAIDNDASGEVFSRGAFIINQDYNLVNFIDTEHQATALIDGNILIRRVDADGNPLAGVKYVIDGIRASSNSHDGSYIYDPNGEISEFETNTDGEILISNVPFGEYTATETSSLVGHEPDATVITNNLRRNMKPIKLKSVMNFGALDLAQLDGDVYPVEPITMLDNGIYGTTLGQEVEQDSFSYDSGSNSYKANSGMGNFYELEKSEDGILTIHFLGTDTRVPFSRDKTSGKLVALINSYDLFYAAYGPGFADNMYMTVSEDTKEAVLVDSSSETILSFDDKQECYVGTIDGEAIRMCNDGNGGLWLNIAEFLSSTYVHLEYSERFQKYVMAGDYMFVTIEEESEDQIITGSLFPIMYYAKDDVYVVPMMFYYFAVPHDSTFVAAEFLFRDKTTDVAPENIPNPQTGDAVIKTIIITVAGLAPVLMLRKRLTRR